MKTNVPKIKLKILLLILWPTQLRHTRPRGMNIHRAIIRLSLQVDVKRLFILDVCIDFCSVESLELLVFYLD